MRFERDLLIGRDVTVHTTAVSFKRTYLRLYYLDRSQKRHESIIKKLLDNL